MKAVNVATSNRFGDKLFRAVHVRKSGSCLFQEVAHTGKPVPGISAAAMQMGKHVAKIIKAELNAGSNSPQRPPFKYWDKGTMATIGRSAAVAQMGRLKLAGYPAWLAWLSST